MAITTVSATVHPSANDLVKTGGTAGDGQNLREWPFVDIMDKSTTQNFRVSGFALSSSGLTLTIGAGIAIVRGQRVDANPTNVTLPDNTTSYVYLKLLVDAQNRVSSVVYEDKTVLSPPAESHLLVAIATTSGGVITAIFQSFAGPPTLIPRVEVFTASGTFRMPCDRSAVYVVVTGGGGGGGGGGGYSNGAGAPGGHGGSGGYAAGRVSLTPGSTVTVTVGGGGAGGAGGDVDSNGTAGQSGGQSSFGSFLIATGGGGGEGGLAGASTNYGRNGQDGYIISGAEDVAGTGGAGGGTGGAGGVFGNVFGSPGIGGAPGRVVVYY